MIAVGVDVGSLTAEAVAVDGRHMIASVQIPVQPDPLRTAEDVLHQLDGELRKRGLGSREVAATVATGYGRERVEGAGLAHQNVSEISCHSYGAFSISPSVRTVIDVGGQDAKVIRIDERGDIEDFAMNDKCAAGAGHFLELMSRTLEVGLNELGPLALGSRQEKKMSSRCSIFIETEVIHFLQLGAKPADLAAGVCASMADRVASLARRVGVVPKVTMTGGVAKNLAVRREVERRLSLRLIDLPVDPQLIGAYGAAMLAQRRRREEHR